jgi:hypothetical protein
METRKTHTSLKPDRSPTIALPQLELWDGR